MDIQAIVRSLPTLADGMQITLLLSLVSAFCALLTGAMMVWIRQRGPSLLQKVVQLYSDITLALPLLVVIYILYFVLPEYDITLSSPAVGILALTLYYAPYMAQVMRAALQAIGKGQWEATRVLGLSRMEALREVVLPQALPQMLSPLTGLLIGLIKDSALLSVVSVPEFMYAAKQAISDTYAPVEIYLTVALTYWLINSLLDYAARRVERSMTRYLGRAA